MSFRVQPDGAIECDTAEEALELRNRILGTVAITESGSDSFRAFVLSLKQEGRSFVSALLDNPDGLLTNQLAGLLRIEATVLGPMVRQIRAAIARSGLANDFGLATSRVQVDAHLLTSYRLVARFSSTREKLKAALESA